MLRDHKLIRQTPYMQRLLQAQQQLCLQFVSLIVYCFYCMSISCWETEKLVSKCGIGIQKITWNIVHSLYYSFKKKWLCLPSIQHFVRKLDSCFVNKYKYKYYFNKSTGMKDFFYSQKIAENTQHTNDGKVSKKAYSYHNYWFIDSHFG